MGFSSGALEITDDPWIRSGTEPEARRRPSKPDGATGGEAGLGGGEVLIEMARGAALYFRSGPPHPQARKKHLDRLRRQGRRPKAPIRTRQRAFGAQFSLI